MKELPIIMGPESVRAILDGRKTQTRRVVNKKALERFKFSPSGELLGSFNESHPDWEIYPTIDDAPYKVGDRLWVRETYCTVMGGPPFGLCFYRADSESIVIETQYGTQYMSPDWKSPMFMPKAMSRIMLEVTNIRVERVQDICWDDCIREGICSLTLPENLGNQELYEWLEKKSAPRPLIKSIEDLKESYRVAWNDLNAKRGYPWESNPWVWVISFKLSEGRNR